METRPLYLAGREASLRRFRAVVRAAPELPANIRLTGLRGVGKTVLLGEFGAAAKELNWATTQLELLPGQNTDAGILSTLHEALRATREEISRIQRLKAVAGAAARFKRPNSRSALSSGMRRLSQALLRSLGLCSTRPRRVQLPAAGRCRPQRSCQQDAGNVNVVLGRLVESGVLHRIRKGQYEYTAPKFRDYLIRRTAPPGQTSLL